MKLPQPFHHVRIALILGMLVAAPAVGVAAGDEWTVLRADESPRTMLYRALERQARELLAERRKAVAALKTPEAVRERQKAIRAKFLEALGDLPEKTPLNGRVVGSDKRDGYKVERVIYESRPNHHVTAALYLPDAPPPYPGVLVPCGHSQNGKAAEPYQRICILLAKNGMAALCFDPIGQGERVQLLNDQGKPAIAGSTTEHTLSGTGALLVGRSAATYRIWDAIRSLDYLASRPEIDPNRLGCTGNSGGGTETAYLMALDDRVAVAAPSCYITSLERLFATIGPQDAEQNITGQVAFGMDHGDYAILRAPKPTLFSVGTQDFFDISGSWDTFREVKLVYGRLGYGERVDLFESDEPHGFTKPRRESATRWLRRWLLKKDDAPVEAAFAVATDAQLQCTRTGQVLSDFHDKSVFDLNAERARELEGRRGGSRPKAELLADVRRLIGLRDSIPPASKETRGEVKRPGGTVTRLAFTTEPGVVLPALLFTPENMAGDPPLVVHVGYNWSEQSAKESVADELLKKGKPYLVVDLRGMGETAPAGRRPGSPGGDEKESFLSLHLARPLLGQRVYDLLAVIAAVAERSTRGVVLEASGRAGPIALHAAALEPRISSLNLHSSVTSWTDVVRTPLSRGQLASAVPGALAVYDLPDLAAAIAPRPLTIRAAVDPAGRAVSQAKIGESYAAALRTYRDLGSERALTLKAGQPEPTLPSQVRTADLSIGATETVTLADGKTAAVKLVGLDERVDPIRAAVREALVRLEVNGKPVTISSGNYNRPVAAGGIRVDSPVTRGYRANTGEDHWALEKDARVRLWPASGPLIDPSTFVYPAGQRWFASLTQMANEPVYVDGGEQPSVKKIYYHSGLDIGGAEGLVDVIAATDGVVVSSGTTVMQGFEPDHTPVRPRYDVVYLLDDRGWYYRYSHMQTIDPAITPGASVRMGQKIGVLGKEGGSGGWSHLHFEIKSLQPSGKYGTEEGYAYLWQAAEREQKPEIVAVARPHRFTWAGETVTLDGSKSWSRTGPITRYEWTFTDGSTSTERKPQRSYDRPGSYSEILKVTDRAGHEAYDFAIVQVLDREHPDQLVPTIHAAYAPTQRIKAGDPVTFKVRTFRNTYGQETWDFGDGSPPVDAHSDGNVDQHAKDGYAVTTHRFEKPGHYLVRVERSDRRGARATARLSVLVEKP